MAPVSTCDGHGAERLLAAAAAARDHEAHQEVRIAALAPTPGNLEPGDPMASSCSLPLRPRASAPLPRRDEGILG
jgi:hypothetical protein